MENTNTFTAKTAAFEIARLCGGVVHRGYGFAFGGFLELHHSQLHKVALCFFAHRNVFALFADSPFEKYGAGWASPLEDYILRKVSATEDGLLVAEFEFYGQKRFLVVARAMARFFIVDNDGNLLWAHGATPKQHFEMPVEFACTFTRDDTLENTTRQIECGLMARLVNDYLTEQIETQRIKEIKRLERAIAQTFDDLQKHSTCLLLRERADTIMANLHAILPKTERAILQNPHTGLPIEIVLDAMQTPQAYAASIYARARRGERGIKIAKQRISELEDKLLILFDLEGKPYEVVAKHLKILPESFLGKKPNSLPDKTIRTALGDIRRFDTADGFAIFVGKNAAANNRLTFSVASKDDIWLHAQSVKGSHVVIKRGANAQVPRTIVEKAAALAAFFSDAKHSSLVPVMFTPRRYVHAVKGALGQVRVDRFESILITPSNPFG